MERRELEQIIKQEDCISGGTKEACIKIREVLCNKMNPGNQLHAPGSCISINEFVEAVEVLLAFADDKPDTKVSMYHCENDCIFVGKRFCPGKMMDGISNKGMKPCPGYTQDEL